MSSKRKQDESARDSNVTVAADTAGTHSLSEDHKGVIWARNISKYYPLYRSPQDRLKQSLWRGRRNFFEPFWAIRDVSVEIQKGLTVGVIGLNGSGKSTLLQIVAGILTPITGELEVRGRVAALLELGSGFNPEFTGRENIFFYGSLFGMRQSEIEERLGEIIAFADIGEFIDQPIKTYSSGMMLRLAFSVIVHIDFDILLIDEAIAVGDSLFQLKCYQRIREFKKRGKTILLVTHDMGAVHQICDRAILMHKGRLVIYGGLKEVTDVYIKNILRLGSAETNACEVRTGEDLRLGDNSMEIVRHWVGNHEEAAPIFKYGEVLDVFLEIRFKNDIERPVVGLIVKTLNGYEIAGYNNWYASRDLSPRERGHRNVYRISFPMLLNPGDFYMTLGAAYINGSEIVRGDYIECAFAFKVLPKQMLWSGLVDFGFTVSENESSK